MKLRIYKLLESILRRALEEVEWRVLYHTPVGPNPHAGGTLEYLLWEKGNQLAATIRLRRVHVGKNPWLTLVEKEDWPDQMGETP